MNRLSVLALFLAVAMSLTYALTFARQAPATTQANSFCGCVECECPDCNGETCTCDVCECVGCACAG